MGTIALDEFGKPNPNVIYRGRTNPSFGLWRYSSQGYWLFCLPVAGSRWRRTETPDEASLTRLVDEVKPAADGETPVATLNGDGTITVHRTGYGRLVNPDGTTSSVNIF